MTGFGSNSFQFRDCFKFKRIPTWRLQIETDWVIRVVYQANSKTNSASDSRQRSGVLSFEGQAAAVTGVFFAASRARNHSVFASSLMRTLRPILKVRGATLAEANL
jgi:hypothetical protein